MGMELLNYCRTRYATVAIFAILLGLLSFNVPVAAASVGSLEFMSILFPSQVPYDQTIHVSITLNSTLSTTPSVSVFYWILSNSSAIGQGWKVAPAGAVMTLPAQNLTVYCATLPNQVFGERLAYGMRVVFWAQAVSGSTTISTAEASSMWNPKDIRGKYVVQIVDPHPAKIDSVNLYPNPPTSADITTVQVSFEKPPQGANMTRAELEYSVNGVMPGTNLTMIQLSPSFFKASIPAQPRGATVSYLVMGEDAAGNVVETSPATYVVQPSQADIDQANRSQIFQTILIGGPVAIILLAALTIFLYKRRGRMHHTARSLALDLLSERNAFITSVILSITVTGWAAYSISQFGQVWLGLVSLIVIVELWGLIDPKLRTMFGASKAPESGLQAALFEVTRMPGGPLLASAYTLVAVETVATLFMYVGGFIDLVGLKAISSFFASYALMMVALAAALRYLTYTFMRD